MIFWHDKSPVDFRKFFNKDSILIAKKILNKAVESIEAIEKESVGASLWLLLEGLHFQDLCSFE